jgi:hypothetical protein
LIKYLDINYTIANKYRPKRGIWWPNQNNQNHPDPTTKLRS